MLLHQGLQVWILVVFDAEKRLRQFLFGELPQFFAVSVAVSPPHRLPFRGSTAAKMSPSCTAVQKTGS